jgi:ribosomal protein L29
MKKVTHDLAGKSIEELQKEVAVLKADIAKLFSTRKAKPEKDTNAIAKKQKKLAVALTLITQKNLTEKK